MPEGRRAANLPSESSARSRSKSGGGVAGRSTPPSGSFTPTASPGEEHPAQRVVQTRRGAWRARASPPRRGCGPGPTSISSPSSSTWRRSARRGVEAAVERVEQRPVDACRRVDEPGRVGQVARPLLVHVDRGRGKGAGHVADTACVVEVDVGDRHPRQFVGPDPDLLQCGEQDRDRGLAPGLDEHRRGPFDEVPGRHPLPTTEHGVDLGTRRSGTAVGLLAETPASPTLCLVHVQSPASGWRCELPDRRARRWRWTAVAGTAGTASPLSGSCQCRPASAWRCERWPCECEPLTAAPSGRVASGPWWRANVARPGLQRDHGQSFMPPLLPCFRVAGRTPHRGAPVRRRTATRPSFLIRCNLGMVIVSATRCGAGVAGGGERIRAAQPEGGIDQRDVGEGLREVAHQPSGQRVVLLGEQAEVVAQGQEPLEELLAPPPRARSCAGSPPARTSTPGRRPPGRSARRPRRRRRCGTAGRTRGPSDPAARLRRCSPRAGRSAAGIP